MLELVVCGAGNWGKNVVRTFDALPDVHLRYICDLSEPIRQRAAKQYPHATVTDDLRVALEDERVDAVAIAVEAPHHFKLVEAALEANKHVFVEKPLTLDAGESQQLIDLAERQGRKLMVGHLLEYHPAVEYMKQMVEAGELDPMYSYSQRVNLGVIRRTENAWWSLAPHDISVACYLMGAEPVSVTATGKCYVQPDIEDVVFANLQFADGRMSHIHVSWLDPHKLRKMTLVGRDKMVVFDDMVATEKVRIYDKGAHVKKGVDSYAEAITLRQGDVLIPAVPNVEPLRAECEHFVRSIVADTTPRSDGADGLRVVRVLEAGAASMAQDGAPVSIGDAAEKTNPASVGV